MRFTLPLRQAHLEQKVKLTSNRPPLISINNATFYRRQPDASRGLEDPANKPLFPGLTLEIPAVPRLRQYWAIIGPSNAGKTTLLEILQGKHLCFPPNARTYPYLSTDEIAEKDHRLRHPSRAIQYVGFSDKQRGLSGLGTYMSARYESRREATDYSVRNFLLGNTELNAEAREVHFTDHFFAQVLKDLNLQKLIDMPASNLSNGQTRRARIAKALLNKPELLLLDEPFMGLDPPTTAALSPLLVRLARNDAPRVLITLRPQDPVPRWITHVLYLGEELQVTDRGPKAEVLERVGKGEHRSYPAVENLPEIDMSLLSEAGQERYNQAREAYAAGKRDRNTIAALKLCINNRSTANHEGTTFPEEPAKGEPLIEMDGAVVKYGDRPVLGNWRQKLGDVEADKDGLHWTVRRGERWGVFGPNGSGKTTLLSMITSDHPQSYAAPLKLFGRSRLPTPGRPGISLFELQSRIGHSSPEVHSFFPRHLTLRRAIESAYADTPISRPSLTSDADLRVDALLRWFQEDLYPPAGANPHVAATAHHLTPPRTTSHTDSSAYRAAALARDFSHAEALRSSVDWADTLPFSTLPFSSQRLTLFLRALVRGPDIVILDEAFSGMDERLRDKCLLFLAHGEAYRFSPLRAMRPLGARGWADVEKRRPREMRDAVWTAGLEPHQALVVVAHVKEEVPSSVREWMFLPSVEAEEGGRVCRVGRVEGRPLRVDDVKWREIWGLSPGRGRKRKEEVVEEEQEEGRMVEEM